MYSHLDITINMLSIVVGRKLSLVFAKKIVICYRRDNFCSELHYSLELIVYYCILMLFDHTSDFFNLNWSFLKHPAELL